MKKITLAALLAGTALSSLSAFAGPVRFTGELAFGSTSHTGDDSSTDDQDPLSLSGRGSLYVPFSNTNLSVTLDLFGENGWQLTDLADDDYDAFGGAAHFTYRKAGKYSLGLVGGAMLTNIPSDEEPDYWIFGAEGKFMLDRGALYAQVGHLDTMDGDDDNVLFATSFARFGINYYPADDLKLSAEYGRYVGDVESDDGLTLNMISVEIEHQISQQFSIFGGYGLWEMQNIDESDILQADGFRIGLRVRLGEGSTGSLMSHEETNSIGIPPVIQPIASSDVFD